MKNRYLSTTLVVSILFNVYLFSETRDLQSEVTGLSIKLNTDKVTLSQASIKDISTIKTKSPTLAESEVTDVVSNPTMYTGLPTEQDLAESQERWKENITEFFTTGLDLRESAVDQYYEIKDSRERELSKYLTELVRSQGSFIYTLENMVEENKINEKYLNQLKNLMGVQGYKAYKAFRDLHNHQMIESQQMHSLIEL